MGAIGRCVIGTLFDPRRSRGFWARKKVIYAIPICGYWTNHRNFDRNTFATILLFRRRPE